MARMNSHTPDFRRGLRKAWGTDKSSFTLDFTSKERYCRAVRYLLNSEKWRLECRGRYSYSGLYYGYVTFRRAGA